MPAKIVAKYTSKTDEHYMGLPARDITEEEFARLSDDQKALLAESKFYTLRHDAPAEAEKAARRAEKAESELSATEAPTVPAPPLAPGKK
jgi:hypothetical protein